jgi:hypothetical protein
VVEQLLVLGIKKEEEEAEQRWCWCGCGCYKIRHIIPSYKIVRNPLYKIVRKKTIIQLA